MFEAFFFGAKFGRMRNEAAARAARGMFYVQHFVIKDVFNHGLRNARAVHATV